MRNEKAIIGVSAPASMDGRAFGTFLRHSLIIRVLPRTSYVPKGRPYIVA